jgi:hypothetical protein
LGADLEPLDAIVAGLEELINTLKEASLYGHGCHKQKGEWRHRRA